VCVCVSVCGGEGCVCVRVGGWGCAGDPDGVWVGGWVGGGWAGGGGGTATVERKSRGYTSKRGPRGGQYGDNGERR
jgi:hypothetical protein